MNTTESSHLQRTESVKKVRDLKQLMESLSNLEKLLVF